jgi:hypothetical protein
MPACVSGQYPLRCVSPGADDAGRVEQAPTPSAALKCVFAPTFEPGDGSPPVPFSEPPNDQVYCCPCGQ